MTKQQVNKRGYNKFLKISKDIEVVISEQKISEDSKWDGLKGYITNTHLDANRVIAEYYGLWVRTSISHIEELIRENHS